MAGILYDEKGFYLLARKKPGLPLAGYWEFPGGKQEEGESPEQTLEREIKEELGIALREVKHCYSYTFNNRAHTLHFMVCEAYCLQKPEKLSDHDQLVWLHPDATPPEPVAEADRPILEFLKTRRSK